MEITRKHRFKVFGPGRGCSPRANDKYDKRDTHQEEIDDADNNHGQGPAPRLFFEVTSNKNNCASNKLNHE